MTSDSQDLPDAVEWLITATHEPIDQLERAAQTGQQQIEPFDGPLIALQPGTLRLWSNISDTGQEY